MTVEVIHGDCIEAMSRMAENLIDAVVTDPPYHLQSSSKRFANSPRSESTESSAAGPFKRHGAGFMNQRWDGGDIAMRPETWATVLRVMKPGAHLVAFGGTRTHHRIWCAIEDAGFEVRDTIMFIYGSGMVKAKSTLKPAYEPIILARKPLIGTIGENVARWGTGTINGELCLVGGEGGRWPANVAHDGSDEVLETFPEAVGQIADTSTSSSSRKNQNVYGTMKRGNGRENEPSARSDNQGVVGFKMKPGARRSDSGSAARFFYCSKASKGDRDEGNDHPTVKPTALMQWLCRLVTPQGGLVLDPFMGSGSTGKAALLEGFSFLGIEREEAYVEIARRRLA